MFVLFSKIQALILNLFYNYSQIRWEVCLGSILMRKCRVKLTSLIYGNGRWEYGTCSRILALQKRFMH